MEPERLLEPFCGCGGMGFGFGQHFKVEEAIDVKQEAVDTYHANHRDCTVKCADIHDISGLRGDFDGIAGVIGGPPCQPYSQLNLRKNPLDPRRKLSAEFMRLVTEIQPRFFVMENVPYTPETIKQMVRRTAKHLGYCVTSVYLNSAKYGAAQYRRRWIAVGVRGAMWQPPVERQSRTVRYAFEQIEDNWGLMNTTPEKQHQFEALETVGKWTAISDGHFANAIRLSWDGWTM